MRYLSIVSILPTVDGGRHTPSLEKQTGVQAQEQSKVLLWTEAAAKRILNTKKNQYQFKCTLYLEYFHRFTLPSDSPF